MARLMALLVVIMAAALGRRADACVAVAVENSVAVLTCPGAKNVITGIATVSYSACFCPLSNAQAKKQVQIVSSLCLGQHTCKVSATNAVFGETCSGRLKELEITFVCGPPPPTVLTMSCGDGKVITGIDSVVMDNPACISPNAKDVLWNRCAGHTSCSILVTEAEFMTHDATDCEGTKALAQPICEYPSSECSAIVSASANAGSPFTLTCPENDQIIEEIQFASYGQPTTYQGDPIVNPNCHHPTSTPVVYGACVGQHSCTIGDPAALFADPCPTQSGTNALVVVARCGRRPDDYGVVVAGFADEFVHESCSGQGRYAAPLLLQCPRPDQVISRILFASFGLPKGGVPDAVCDSPHALPIVERACVGQRNCSIVAWNDAFLGDPCPFDHKHMNVLAECTEHRCLEGCDPSLDVTVNGAAAEDQTFTLQCGQGQVIDRIEFATYGTPATTPARFTTIDPKCHYPNSMEAVWSRCVGRQSCSFVAGDDHCTDVFGSVHDPCPTTTKQLRAVARCSTRGDDDLLVMAGEDDEFSLECAEGQVIDHIVFASFGAPVAHSSPLARTINPTCHHPRSMSVVWSRCIGKHKCTFAASDDRPGDAFHPEDPCPSVTKQLRVVARCKPRHTADLALSMRQRHHSHGTHTDTSDAVVGLFTCPKPSQVITEVVFASYGTPDGDVIDRGCHAVTSQAVIEQNCLGEHSCWIEANDESFGEDPCPGVMKQLNVRVRCDERPEHQHYLLSKTNDDHSH